MKKLLLFLSIALALCVENDLPVPGENETPFVPIEDEVPEATEETVVPSGFLNILSIINKELPNIHSMAQALAVIEKYPELSVLLDIMKANIVEYMSNLKNLNNEAQIKEYIVSIVKSYCAKELPEEECQKYVSNLDQNGEVVLTSLWKKIKRAAKKLGDGVKSLF